MKPNLKQIVFLKFLEHASFELDEVVGHHDGEQGLVVRVEGDVERRRLKQHQHRVQEDVDDRQTQMGQSPCGGRDRRKSGKEGKEREEAEDEKERIFGNGRGEENECNEILSNQGAMLLSLAKRSLLDENLKVAKNFSPSC